jgi:excisionase family DNA binding protein
MDRLSFPHAVTHQELTVTHVVSARNRERTEIRAMLDEAGIGVSADRFLGLVREALGSVGRTSPASPASQLTESEIERLRAGGLDPDAGPELAERARARTAARTAALLASSLSVADAAARLHVDPSRVRQLLSERGLYGVKDGGGWRIPEFQVSGARLVPNLAAVVSRIPPGTHPLGVLNWFVRPDPDLAIEGRHVSPLEWLESGGDPEPAAALATDL